MTRTSSEFNHNHGTDESPIPIELVPAIELGDETTPSEESLRAAHLFRQLGMSTIDHLTRAVQSEHGPNQQIEDTIKSWVVGQDQPIESLVAAIDSSVLRDTKQPYCSFLFLGPTGVGKTEVGRALNYALHGNEKGHYTRIDCSDYQTRGHVTSLNGASPTYIGYDQVPKLSQKFIKGDKHILVFDELEKADPALFDILLQILEEGELAMQNSTDVTQFGNCIVIVTSNLGAQDVSKALENKNSGFSPKSDVQSAPSMARLQKIVDDAVKRTLRPELIGRFDKRILFHPLNDMQLGKVVERANDKLNVRLHPQGYKLHLSDDFVAAIVESDDERRQYGGRHITKTLKNTISPHLGKLISSGSIPVGSDVYAVLGAEGSTNNKEGDKLNFELFFAPNNELREAYKKAHPGKEIELTEEAESADETTITIMDTGVEKKLPGAVHSLKPVFLAPRGDATDINDLFNNPANIPWPMALALHNDSKKSHLGFELRSQPELQELRKRLGILGSILYEGLVSRLLLGPKPQRK